MAIIADPCKMPPPLLPGKAKHLLDLWVTFTAPFTNLVTMQLGMSFAVCLNKAAINTITT